MLDVDARQVAAFYQDARARITALVTGLDDAGLNTPVAACPGWSVRNVLAHMAATADDWSQGRLRRAPTDEETATQVARFDGHSLAAVLEAWSVAADRLDHVSETEGTEPPVGDIACHEHDIRGAIGRPGARDSDAVRYTADRLLANLDTPVLLRVITEDGEYRCGPEVDAELVLHTTRFEALRWRTGRRSRRQLTAMDWSDDPARVIDHLCMFGPTETDIDE